MCGIAGFYLKEPNFIKNTADHQKMESFLNQLLLGIEPRGRDATGFLAITNDGKSMRLDKQAEPAQEFLKDRKTLPTGTRIVLAHTRYVTKGPASNWFNNHPVGWGSVFITHNGSISNDDRLFKEKKWTRHAQVDSEIIAALIKNEGWDDVAKLNKTLSGGYAVAAADLEKPDELLLFKGATWPLAYHDNKNFLVWASEGTVIQKAWGAVLGTPPKLSSIEHLSYGESIKVKNGEVSFQEAPKSASSKNSYSSRPNWENGWEEEEDYRRYGTCVAPWELERNGTGTQSSTPAVVSSRDKLVRDNSVQIHLMRKDGLGKAVTWEMRKSNSLSEEQKISFVGKWEWCSSCRTSIVSNDMFSTLAWGRICIDCHSFLSNPANDGNEPEPPSGTVFNELQMIDNLEDWVEIESKIYYEAMLTVSDNTGLQVSTVDYVLQRITPKELIANPKMRELKDEVHAEFEAAENHQWEQYSIDSLKREEDRGPGKCASYNQIDIKCPGCEFCIIDVEAKVEDEEVIGVQPFADEGLWVTCAVGTHKTNENCDACGTGKPDYSSPATKPDTAEKSPTQCMTGKCRKKAKVSMINDQGKFRWCYNHYKKCSVKGCQEESRGCDPAGSRFCHEHFRGIKGGIQDIRKVKQDAVPV